MSERRSDDVRLNLRMTRSQREMVKRAAIKRHLTVSAFVRVVVLGEAARVLNQGKR